MSLQHPLLQRISYLGNGVWVSDYDSASNIKALKERNILLVVNVSDEDRPVDEQTLLAKSGILYIFRPCHDNAGTDIVPIAQGLFDVTFSAWEESGSVLFHCHQGMGVAAYMLARLYPTATLDWIMERLQQKKTQRIRHCPSKYTI